MMEANKPNRAPGGLLLALILLSLSTVSARADDRVHVVRRNETLSAIARKYEVPVRSLASWNHLADADVLRVGTRLRIPDPDDALIRYVVRKGDSIAAIAARHGQSVDRLAKLNHLTKPDHIEPGQTLLIPAGQSRFALPASLQSEIDRASIKSGRWKHIIIHHSSSRLDNPEIMDRHHREVRHMENGLAYHFVIGGNGPRMKDGEIHIGDRWKKQLQGGHLASERLNDESIGICLVGNFNEDKPTEKQMAALAELVEFLLNRCRLAAGDVDTHKHINPKPTQCPGRHFSLADLKRRLGRSTAGR